MTVAELAHRPVPIRNRLPSAARQRVAALLLLSVPLLVAWIALWPGHMNLDTISQIQMVRTRQFDDRYCPILQWLWATVYPLGIGPGVVFLGQVAGVVIGLYLVLRCALGRVGAALAAALICLSPPVLSVLVVLGRDGWFAALALLSIGAALHAASHQKPERTRWMIVALAAAWFALAARQNAPTVIVVPVAFVVALWLGDRGMRQSKRLGPVIVAAVGLIALALALALGSQLALRKAIGVIDEAPQQPLYEFDLMALSHYEHENLFPQQLLARDYDLVAPLYNPDSVIPIAEALGGQFIPGSQRRLIAHAWRRAVRDEPLAYLRVRSELFLRQVNLTAPPLSAYHPGIDANPWGYRLRSPAADAVIEDYLTAFMSDPTHGSVVYRVWIYLLVAGLGVLFFVRRRGSLPILGVGMLGLAAWGLQIGLFFGAPGTEYRFQLLTVITGLVLPVLGLGAWRSSHTPSRQRWTAWPERARPTS